VLSFSTTKLLCPPQEREERLIRTIKRALRRMCNHGEHTNQRRLLSALNVGSEEEIPHSVANIPSIERIVMSRKELNSLSKEDDHGGSDLSIDSPSYCVLESEPELMLSYVCLIERAMKELGTALSPKQNGVLAKGVWNLLIKYWWDDCEGCLYSVDSAIEWGIL
jgi:hypothetical protein